MVTNRAQRRGGQWHTEDMKRVGGKSRIEDEREGGLQTGSEWIITFIMSTECFCAWEQ